MIVNGSLDDPGAPTLDAYESLTPARQGGLASMLQRMQQAAQRHVAR